MIDYYFYLVTIQTLQNYQMASGDGYLIYYLKDVGIEKPNLVVHLKNNESGEATAEIFENPILDENVLIEKNPMR